MLNFYSNIKHKTLVRLNGKTIGYIIGNQFLKTVYGSRHRLKFPLPAWCVSKEIFEQEIKLKCSEIVVEDQESKKTYRTSIETFTKNCFLIKRGGFETQLALAEKYWEIEGSNEHKQLCLFDAGGLSNA